MLNLILLIQVPQMWHTSPYRTSSFLLQHKSRVQEFDRAFIERLWQADTTKDDNNSSAKYIIPLLYNFI